MLSKRLQAVFDMIHPCHTLLDIGADHAYLAIAVAENRKADKIICAENKEGPLNRGISNVQRYQLEQVIDFRLSDGALNIEDHCDCWTMAGIGSETILRIINQSITKAQNTSQIIIQPQSKIELLRLAMNQLKFELTDENIVFDNGYYFVLSYRYNPKCNVIDESDTYLGPILRKKKPELYQQWLIEMNHILDTRKEYSALNLKEYQIFNQELKNSQF